MGGELLGARPGEFAGTVARDAGTPRAADPGPQTRGLLNSRLAGAFPAWRRLPGPVAERGPQRP
ncbi:hypothetical protein ACH4UM_07085 [Streptomyces sp. NPDC020801]|uniref:hypothetical protein n=1 Tax=unclassified Streptomyces TaxID=2593676 RepID=UPI00379AF9DE